MPTRKIRPAAKTQMRVAAKTRIIPESGCQIGTPGGTDCLTIMSIGVRGGMRDIASANVEFGSRTTLNHTNIGLTSSSMTGVIMLCASFMSVTEAPIAMKIEPNIKMASDRKAINHHTWSQGKYCT